MQPPTIMTTLRDNDNNVTYNVLAYRHLSRDELIMSVRMYHSQPSVRRRKKPFKNATITIVSILGATPGL